MAVVVELAEGIFLVASRFQALYLYPVEQVVLRASPPLHPAAGWRPRSMASTEGAISRVEACPQWL